MSTQSNIFNVAEPHGAEFETTAAEALAHAPTSCIARQVDANAEHERQAAEQAASVAKTLGPKYTGEQSTAIDKLRNESSQKMDEAVEEGKRDVADTKAAGAEYVQQAKEMASNAAAAAQERLPSIGSGRSGGETTAPRSQDSSTTGGLTATLQDTAASVINTATSYVASAREVAQPHVDRAVAAAQNMLGTTGTQGAQMKDMPASSTGIPATSAPLESGPHKVGSPYPSTTTKTGTKDIGQNAPEKSVN